MVVSFKICRETDIMFEHTLFFCTSDHYNVNYTFSWITEQEFKISQKQIIIKTFSVYNILMLKNVLKNHSVSVYKLRKYGVSQ